MELEIRAVKENEEGDIEVCFEEEAQLFSVYVGKPGSFCCIGDFPVFPAALTFASYLSNEWDIPFIDRIARRDK